MGRNKEVVVSAAVLVVKPAAMAFLVVKEDGLDEYGLPHGTVEPGEKPKKTAEREALEETGVPVIICRKLQEFRGKYKGRPRLGHLFAAKLQDPDGSFPGGNTLHPQWLPKKELEEYRRSGLIRPNPIVRAMVDWAILNFQLNQ